MKPTPIHEVIRRIRPLAPIQKACHLRGLIAQKGRPRLLAGCSSSGRLTSTTSSWSAVWIKAQVHPPPEPNFRPISVYRYRNYRARRCRLVSRDTTIPSSVSYDIKEMHRGGEIVEPKRSQRRRELESALKEIVNRQLRRESKVA